MKILFLDQSGQLGGAELCLADLAQYYGDRCRVCTFAPGPFPEKLRQQQIAVEVLAEQGLRFQKQSGAGQAVKALKNLGPLIYRVSRLSWQYDCIYANTQKALVVGAIASRLSRKPLVYHLHDIVSPEHFSDLNQRIIVTSANQAALVIANSKASQTAFVAAGGRAELTHIVYNGFDLGRYPAKAQRQFSSKKISEEISGAVSEEAVPSSLRLTLGTADQFVVGHFSRLSPWKGQHVLIDALQHCPASVTAVFVGGALFGEDSYTQQLQRQIETLKLGDRVKFLGFCSDIPALMSACDLIAHTSTAAEPFGRVIVEGMLCDRPVVAAAAGGALEIIEHNKTGWLTPPGDARKLADIIMRAYRQPELAAAIAQQGKAMAQQRFNLENTNAQIDRLLKTVL